MRSIILISVVCLQLGWSYGASRSAGAYSYGDTSGNRYGGTYGSDGEHFFRNVGFFPPIMTNYWSVNEFFPDYFANLESLLQEAFQSNIDNQKRAYTAARKAYDLTYNQAGYNTNFPSRFDNFGGLGDFPGFPMAGRGGNRAYAGGVVTPDFTHQVAGVDPKNPRVHNVNVMSRFADTSKSGDDDNKYYSVSSSSFVTSSNVDGKDTTHRKAETVVNRNGEVTKYKVED